MSTPAKAQSGYKKKRRVPPVRSSYVLGVSSGASSFTGWTLEVPTPIATARGAPLEVPTPIATASGKKLALARPAARVGVEVGQAEQASVLSEEASDPLFEGLRMLLVEIIQGAVRRLAKCQHCNTILDVKESLGMGHKAGVVTRIVLFCPQCGKEEFFSNQSQAKPVNSKLVFASKLVGLGCAGADTFCRALRLPSTLGGTTSTKYTEELAQLSIQAAEDSFNVASANLHRHLGVAEDEIVDSVFSCDGTWSKRGHTAGYGVVPVISQETRQVVDCSILSKSCPECVKHQNLDKASKEYQVWWENHEDSCNANFTGSSPAMEQEGALRMWNRSEEKRKLRYTTVCY